jgi:UDP-glucose 4-epimerase
MNKAIIFGANGYLGRHLAFFLMQQNIDFISLGNASLSKDSHENYKQIDITNYDQVSSIDFNVDYIFVFAGITGTDAGFKKYEDFTSVNEVGLLNVLTHLSKSKGTARIIFPSSRLVYKGMENIFLKEDAEKEALTIYAQNKLSCENYLKMYQNYHGIDYTIFRVCVPYGNLIDSGYSYGTLGFFLDKASTGENITLYGNGSQRRTFTHVQDIIMSILVTIESDSSKNETYNIGSDDNMSLFDAAQMVATNNNVGIDFLEWPEGARKIESGDTIFDDSNLKEASNYKYKYNLTNWLDNLS